MKFKVGLLLLLFLTCRCGLVCEARAQVIRTLEELQRPTLRGLEGVEIFASLLFPDEQSPGLTRVQLQTEIESRLRGAAIQVLTPTESLKSPGNPFLYVRVFLTAPQAGGHLCRIDVALNQDVILERDVSMRVVATTWQASWVGMLPQLSAAEILAKLSLPIQRFIEDYRAVNPR
jgi:hypothetical protein